MLLRQLQLPEEELDSGVQKRTMLVRLARAVQLRHQR
jgi:hypothetical protein